MSLRLRNPHSVLATLETRPGDVLEVIVPARAEQRADPREAPAKGDDAWTRVVQLARGRGIPIHAPKAGGAAPGGPGRRSAPPDGGRTGVAEAVVREKQPVSAEELFAGGKERAGGRGLWLALDSLQDPHNVGAIFRSAAFFGVQGIVLTQDRSAPLTATAYDVASGGMEHVPFVHQANLQRAFEIAKEAGLWVLGSSEHAKQELRQLERDRPWLLVLGNEEKGMRRLTEEACDVVFKVGGAGKVTSLNVSVAAGIMISALV